MPAQVRRDWPSAIPPPDRKKTLPRPKFLQGFQLDRQKGGLAGQRSSSSRTLDGYLLGALLHSPQRKNHPMNPLHWVSCRSPLKRYGQPGRYTMCTDPSVMIAPLVMKPLLSLSLMRHASRATSQLHTILIRLRSTLQTQCSVVAQSVTLNTSNPLI